MQDSPGPIGFGGGPIWDTPRVVAPHADNRAGARRASVPKVIYVMGAGRSGSTILGIALGNAEGVVFAGELNKWLARRGTPSLSDPERERLWADVLARMPAGASDLFGGAPSSIERSSALFSPRAWRVRKHIRDRYRAVAEDLFDAIAASTGAQYIVDTSHYPLRARELQALDGIELYLLLLVRDPHAVVASLGRTDVVERRFGTLAANAYLLLTHTLSTLVFLAQPRSQRMLVRYEDLRAQPERVLRSILDLAGSSAEVPELAALATGTPLHGNRLARERTVALERSPEMPARRSLLTRFVQFPLSVVHSRLRPSTRLHRRAPS